jgi:hypothetical protein
MATKRTATPRKTAGDPSTERIAENEDRTGGLPGPSEAGVMWSRVRELVNEYPVLTFFGVVGLVAVITLMIRD